MKKKTLYYNPYEYVEKVHIVSKCFGIDLTYTFEDGFDKPIHLDDLFKLSRSKWFDIVEVYVTPHNEVFEVDGINPNTRISLDGWIDLAHYKKGGGYLNYPFNYIKE